MTHKAVIRIAQIATPDLYLTDTIKPGRELWHTHALQLAPNPVVLINHDEHRAIGRVLELEEWDDINRPLGLRTVRTRRCSGVAAWRLHAAPPHP